MLTTVFFDKVKQYATLSPGAQAAWAGILHEKKYLKGEHFVTGGEVPKKFAFVVSGLLAQYYHNAEGDQVIKYFFPEHRIAGSVSATLAQTPGLFTITALEDTKVLEYDFAAFRALTKTHVSVAEFYMRYMEQHWIMDKEPLEVAWRHDTAAQRYDDFTKKYPELIKRLKKHHIAAYLGITPTQLSRILFANK